MLLGVLGTELPAEVRVLHPVPHKAELFPHSDGGQHADHLMQFVPRFEFQDGPAIFLIAENHPFHAAAELFLPLFLHCAFLPRPGRLADSRPGSNIYS